MAKPDELIAIATSALDQEEPVLAAGIFGLADSFVATATGAVAGAAVADAVGLDNPLADGVAGAAGIHAAREVNAQSKGLSVQMLTAVTDDAVVLWEWPIKNGFAPAKLLTFNRSNTDVTIKKMGLSRRVNLVDRTTGTRVEITGSTAFFSSVSGGDKAVLKQLAAWVQ